ncbi:YraN family protein [Nocardioides sp. KR10-350]|uniref:YraN family protein n=1 Tax=Nocardioides cheoyonin TaxID=3156615 RepID=UPI0032B42C00
MTTTALQKQALGRYGETVAERHLVDQGMLVLDRNWRCDEGEIDLVLRDGDVLVVCEVKTRSSDQFGSPHEAVDDAKVERLRRLADRWKTERSLTNVPDVRFDLVAVRHTPKGAALVDHVRGL